MHTLAAARGDRIWPRAAPGRALLSSQTTRTRKKDLTTKRTKTTKILAELVCVHIFWKTLRAQKSPAFPAFSKALATRSGTVPSARLERPLQRSVPVAAQDRRCPRIEGESYLNTKDAKDAKEAKEAKEA